MLLARDLIAYLSRQLLKRLSPKSIDAANPQAVAEMIQQIIADDLEVEDKLNDEVRELLSQYSDYMRQESISYQEMFRRIKTQMVQKRKIIRASGRETNDGMKLSRDKITDLSHKIVTALRKSRDVRVKMAENDVRLTIVTGLTEVLGIEDKVDREARKKIRTMKREIAEGTEEWDLLFRRFYAEELKKLGIDLNV
jgi:hypothetical protein